MSPASKKLKGQIGLGLFVCPSIYPSTNPTHKGWSGCAMDLGKLPVPGRPTIWMIVGQGPIALAVGAGGGCLDIFTLFFVSFSGRRPDID